MVVEFSGVLEGAQQWKTVHMQPQSSSLAAVTENMYHQVLWSPRRKVGWLLCQMIPVGRSQRWGAPKKLKVCQAHDEARQSYAGGAVPIIKLSYQWIWSPKRAAAIIIVSSCNLIIASKEAVTTMCKNDHFPMFFFNYLGPWYCLVAFFISLYLFFCSCMFICLVP